MVEDSETLAEAVAARLRAEGHDVRVALDGPSGVELCRAWLPDLVVLDLMLPGFDGLEVCRRVQADRPVPVVMLTARDSETDMLVGLGVGADDYVVKPFSMRELLLRVNACFRGAPATVAAVAAPPEAAASPEKRRKYLVKMSRSATQPSAPNGAAKSKRSRMTVPPRPSSAKWCS